MALRINNTNLPKELDKFKSRELIQACTLLFQKRIIENFNYNSAEYDMAYWVSEALAKSNDQSSLTKEILEFCNSRLIPKEKFAWITLKDCRIHIWVINAIHNLNAIYSINNPSPPLIPILSLNQIPSGARREYFIHAIDNWNTTLSDKEGLVSSLEARWRNGRTPKAQTKWIDEKNYSQLEWAWKYLTKHQLEMSILKPVTQTELYTAIFASLDNMLTEHNFHPAERQLFIEKMKKTWSQKKYRNSEKAKQQTYVSMTKQTRQRLASLVEMEEDKNAHDVIRDLIDKAYLKKLSKPH